MNVYFLTFGKKENSTAQPVIPSGLQPVVMQLKQSCSVRTPILESNQYRAENYCYIPTWNRYYYIREKTYINGAWTYDLECDYLATFKTQIGGTSMLVTRASATFDTNLIDKLYPLEGSTVTDIKTFGDKSTFEDGYFVLTVVGSNANNGGQILYQMNSATFQTFLNDMFAYADTGVSWGSLSDGVKLSVMNPTQYITSCRWYPKAFEVIRDAQDQPVSQVISCGLWVSNTSANLVSTGNYIAREYYNVTVEPHNQASTLGRNMNLSPMSRYILELGCFGVTELDTSLLYDVTSLDIYIYADPFTGIGKARVMGRYPLGGGTTDQKLLCCLDAKYGVDIPLVQAGGFDAGSFNVGTGGLIAKAVNVGMVASMFRHGEENFGSLVGSADECMNGVKYATSSIGQLLVHNLDKHLYAYFQQRVVGDNVNNGRPYWKYTTPATLGSGFMQAMKGVVSLPASDEEMNIVNRYMESGFYYE